MAVGTTIASTLPIYLIGGLAVQIETSIAMTATILGAVVASYWAASAVSSLAVGRAWIRLSERGSLLTSLSLSAVSLFGVAFASPAWPLLLAWSAFAGMANGLGHPGSNALIAQNTSRHRRAVAYGIKQASIPISTLLSGLSVPVFALTVGWRAAFALSGLFAVLVLVFVVMTVNPPRSGPQESAGVTAPTMPASLRSFLWLTAATTFLASAQANSIGAFLVTSAVTKDISASTAGLLLGAGSVVGIITRVGTGVFADRRGVTLNFVAAMLAIGALSLAAMTLPYQWSFVLGAVVAFGGGWGWPGLVHYVVSRASGPYTAQGTGIVQAGTYVGGVIGPFCFGITMSALGVDVAWCGAAVIGALAAVLAVYAARGEDRIAHDGMRGIDE
ncbi:MFS transporter [Rhodococcus opacus]|uniref:MFS transporter n=1 Tax=Rhodococcus opacus TaxID=37919 RepID=UPI0013E09F2C|nr:MFS transporter [Rhodococcus opacus]MDJ0420253.1 MFS transporter [Rhodococcus opacus]